MAEEDYRGITGYHRMHAELTASLYREFPEAIRRIYVVDKLNDPLAEIQKASEYLGVPNLLDTIRQQTNRPDFPANQSGECIPIRKADGSIVNIAFGWPPTRMQDSAENLTPRDIEILAGVKLHEFSHALSGDEFAEIADHYGVNLEFYMAKRLGESRADGFRADALVRNGADIAHLYGLAAAYDRGARIDAQVTDKTVAPEKQVWAYLGELDSYDPGDELLEIAHRYYHDKSQQFPRHYPSSYNFTGLRDSYSRVSKIFRESPDNQPEFAYFLKSNVAAISNAVSTMEGSGKSPLEIRDWINSHPSIFYGVPQTLAAQAYLANEQATRYFSVPSEVSSLEQATGRALEASMPAIQRLRNNTLVTTFLEKISNPNASISQETEAQILQKLRLDGPMVSMQIESYSLLIASNPALRARVDAMQRDGQKLTFGSLAQAIQGAGITIDPHSFPQASSRERWDILRQSSNINSGAMEAMLLGGRTRLWDSITQLSGDQSLRSPEAITAWSLWQQLLSAENPALHGRGLNPAEATQALLRIPTDTLQRLQTGVGVEALMPQLKALVAISTLSNDNTASVSPLDTRFKPRTNGR